MSARAFTFRGQLAMSQGISTDTIDEILLANIPGAISIRKATEDEDRSGTDKWVYLSSGHPLSVDVKVREEDFSLNGHDDLALEVWSVVEDSVPGWTRKAGRRTDYVLWWWKPTGRWCLVPFAMLCAVFVARMDEWTGRYKTARQSTDGRYHSECVFVPRREVWRSIYERFGGQQ